MDNVTLKQEFINWAQQSAKKEFDVYEPFLLACLDEAIELTLNTTINGVPAYKHYSKDKLLGKVLKGWYNTGKSFLQLPYNGVNFIFREIPLPNSDIERRKLFAKLAEWNKLT